MEPICTKTVSTVYGEKTIDVYSCNIMDFDKSIDILITSAFHGSYAPVPNTMFHALYRMGISVQQLAARPQIDLRRLCNLWLSEEIPDNQSKIGRIGCIEMSSYTHTHEAWLLQEQDILTSIKSCFKMLDLACASGIKAECIALPLLGAGNQHISSDLTLIPLINECVNFLKNNDTVKKVYFIDINKVNAEKIADTMQSMYSVQSEGLDVPKESLPKQAPTVFISYTTVDKNVADNLCSKLESRGIKVWYAPRDIVGSDYASAIVKAIQECSHFVTIISKDSMLSEHVLNEIDLAFNQLSRNIRFFPLRIDTQELRPAFSYYLSRQHWMDAHIPPIEERLEEFANKIASASI